MTLDPFIRYSLPYPIPNSMKGGEFFIRDSSGHHYYFKPRQFSAVVYFSESHHGITDIVLGHREMFTNELWKYDDPPWPQLRPFHDESMELFLERCNEMDPDDIDGSLWPRWPSTEDVEKWLQRMEEKGCGMGTMWYGPIMMAVRNCRQCESFTLPSINTTTVPVVIIRNLEIISILHYNTNISRGVRRQVR